MKPTSCHLPFGSFRLCGCITIVETTFLVAEGLQAEILWKAVTFVLADVVASRILSLVQECREPSVCKFCLNRSMCIVKVSFSQVECKSHGEKLVAWQERGFPDIARLHPL